MMLSGWGRYPALECKTVTLRDVRDIGFSIGHSRSLIARGNGRAYGDAALNPEVTLITTKCDRFLNFDTQTGIVECESGLLLSDLLDFGIPHGWFPAVVPGTKFVTIGGLVAADVHGKNHHRDGSFGRCVESLQLALADGTIVTCSPRDNSELFAATIGGMGLTGVILSARIRLRPVTSAMINETTFRAASLDELLALFNEHDSASYSVAWVDCLARGSQFGRGILMLGEHANSGLETDRHPKKLSRSRISVPIDLPGSTLNAWTITAFNELYYRLNKPGKRRRPYDGFFFPLDAIGDWNRIYGKRGFVQYQCVIGGADAERGLRELLHVVADAGGGTFLAVLKKLGPGNPFLSFPMPGYTVTLDFPVRRQTINLLTQLDAIVSEYHGRIYLAKDARAPRELLDRGYPEIDRFRELRRKIDPDRKFRSLLSERLGL